MLAGIRQWGVEETLKRCNGMLAFALWDAEQRTLTLARDRLGKKPLYYGCFAGTWMFASELKALVAHPAFRREIDRDALATYLRFVYLPASLPAILTALRQSIGTAVAVLYIVELIATKRGLGYYIYFHGSTLFDYPKMYAGVLAMSLLGLGLYFLVDVLHRKLAPWQFSDN